MKKILNLTLTILCIITIVFAFSSCNEQNNDTLSSTDTNSNVDTQTNTNTDTTNDSSGDSSKDSDTETNTSNNGNEVPDIPVQPDIDPEVKEKVESLLESKHKLTYNEDGSFRVLVLADLHMQVGYDTARNVVKERIKSTVDKVNPNLVIFTGDNTLYSDTEEKLRANIDIIAGYLEEKQIPWCHVYGNHDYENKALSKHEQHVIYQSYEYCISKDVESVTSGYGNYVHAIYNQYGTIGSVIYLLDSGEYSRYTYGFIQDDQISWYKETSELLQEYNGGKTVPALMAFHIPLIDNRYAYENRGNTEIVYDWEGHKNEHIHSAECDTDLLKVIGERGDVKAIITGHDHLNDYSYNYKGVYLMSCPNISDLGYTDPYIQGSRVLDLNLSTINEKIPTYIERIIERLNPNDFETLENNVSFEITQKQVDEAYKVGTGKINLKIKDGKGVNGGTAIEILRGNADTFKFYIEFTNKGKVGDNKYLTIWADFTQTEIDSGSFGLVTEHGISLPFSTIFTGSSTFYYLPDGETEYQELSLSDNGCFGTKETDSQGMNGKKGYFVFALDDIKQDMIDLTSDNVITGIYFEGALNSNLKFIDKPFYLCDIKLVTDYKKD